MKSYLFGMFGCLFLFTNCSDNEMDSEAGSGRNEVNISFTAQVIGQTHTRAMMSDGQKSGFEVIAYQKKGDKYVYAKSRKVDVKSQNGKIEWSTPDFKLEIGTYRFLSLYNLDDNLTLDYLKDPSLTKTWDEVLASVKLTNTSSNLDINEIFAGGSIDNDESNDTDMKVAEDIDLSASQSENTLMVNLNLSRINSRIDLRFLKFSPTAADGGNDKEQAYTDDERNIFGKKGNLLSVTTSAKPATSWTWEAGETMTARSELSYTTQTTTNMIFGTKTKEQGATDFPEKEGDEKLMNGTDFAHRIAKGAAYYKGAYILPFASGDATLTLAVTLVGKGEAGTSEAQQANGRQERILTAPGVSAEKNKVTVVTFKYRASGNDSDDEENLFNPTIEYTVTIDTQWNGVIHGPSVDI